ncbi:MAG: transposase [Chloroflexi bacterium]|nr:transposase [Chloroflexota bacterium]
MRTQRELYSEKKIVYESEWDECTQCGQPLTSVYTSGWKTVQTMSEVITIAQRPKCCMNAECLGRNKLLRSVRWQQVAPIWCTYGYDVIAQIGWQRQIQRQTFSETHLDLQGRVRLSETQVRALYNYRYLPLLACHERQQMERLKTIAVQGGLWLSLDGLAPEGGEAQLWLVRELQSEVTLRCGWMSQQDQSAFANFLQPIAELGLPVTVVMSDKQRGLVPAVAEVFSGAKHSFCQTHYLGNAAEPISEADEAMKIELRQGVRQEVGTLIRQEKIEKQGVLTVTGGIPSSVTHPEASRDPVVQEQDAILQDLSRRIRYLLTLKGRPPFCLAGIEMFERLSEVKDCLERLMAHHTHPQLVQLQQGLCAALQLVQTNYMLLRQAADWLEQIADLLDPAGKSVRSAAQVRKSLFAFLKKIKTISNQQPGLQPFAQTIQKTTLSYAPGLFHCYDIPGLPRTNNARESDFRDLNRRLLRTTGQKGLLRRIIQRSGAWELLHRPASLQDTILAFNRVAPQDFHEERQRLRQHRDRFRLHTRSAKQSHLQLAKLEQRWANLAPI